MCRGEALPVIAEALNLSRAEVHGVVTFYHDYRDQPAGRHVLKLCRAEACQSMGGDALAAQRPAAARHRLPRDDGRRRGDAGAGLLPRALRLRAGRDARRRGDRPARRRDGSTRSSRRCGHDRRRSTFPAMPARWRSAPRRSPRRSQREIAARGLDAKIVRNGSRGALLAGADGRGRDGRRPRRLWSGRGRAMSPSLFDAGFLDGGEHPRCRSAIPRKFRSWPSQTRLTFARCGITDPLSLDDYRRMAACKGLRSARGDGAGRRSSRQVTESGLRGRGGAGFPTGIKWKTVLDAAGRPQIHRLQCRRGRQRHLRRPHDHGGRSLRADRGHGDRRHRDRRDQGLRLHPLGISACDRGDDARRSRSRARPACSASACSARPTPSTSKSASAPAPMSAARKPRC